MLCHHFRKFSYDYDAESRFISPERKRKMTCNGVHTGYPQSYSKSACVEGRV